MILERFCWIFWLPYVSLKIWKSQLVDIYMLRGRLAWVRHLFPKIQSGMFISASSSRSDNLITITRRSS